jgi:hypothetical protein
MLRSKEAWQPVPEEFTPFSENPGIDDLCHRKLLEKKVENCYKLHL